jgi:hypothetical protein
MKKLLALCAAFCAAAALWGAPVFSGVFDSRFTTGAGAGESPAFFYGMEEYLNLRLRAKVGESVTVDGAFNIIAAAGLPAQTAALAGSADSAGLPVSSYAGNENYAGAIEVERLYFRINGGALDLDLGLMRLAFGYGQVFGPSDFLNPRNPLFPDARPRAVLGTAASFYPADTAKILAFAAAPQNALGSDGGGLRFGVSADKHGDKASVQLLYAAETPQEGSRYGIHRAGFSVKADVEVGLAVDALYTVNPEHEAGVSGLSASGGFDYSFLEGKLYVLAEYLYNGEQSATVRSTVNPTGFAGEQYLYGLGRYSLSDYTSASLACIAALSDGSFAPVIGFDHDISQGVSLSLTGQIPLDKTVFGGADAGELGPGRSRFVGTAKVRIRF